MMNSHSGAKPQKSFLISVVSIDSIVILFYLFLSNPFLFSGIFFSNFLTPYIIKLFLGMFICIRSLKFRAPAWSYGLICFCIIYTLIHAYLHPNSAAQSVADLQDIMFCVFAWNIVMSKENRDKYMRIFLMLSFLIASILIIETFVFLFKPSTFSFQELVGYKVFYNSILGMINIDNERPCWYFAEPSYCGAFLAINIFMNRHHIFKNRFHKFIYYVVLLGGLLSTASFGAFVAIGITLCILMIYRMVNIPSAILMVILTSIIYSYLVFFPNLERDNDNTAIRTHSWEARQKKILIASEVRRSMTFIDVIIGQGNNAVGFKYENGLSDAYNKLFIENGLIFMMIYFIVIFKLLNKDPVVLSYFLLSLMTVIIQLFPLTFLCLFVARIIAEDKYKLVKGAQ